MWRSARACSASARSFRQWNVTPLSSSRSAASTRGLATSKRPNAAAYELLVPAVETFHGRFGHFLVPYSFPVAIDDAHWPPATRGVNIGRRLHALLTNPQHRAQFPHVLAQLDALGFPVASEYKQLVWEKGTFAALRVYYKLYGHSLVPVDFVVPASGSLAFPKETWGLALGKRVATLRDRADRLTDRQRNDLERVAFSFDVDDTHWETKILPALQTFQKIYGHRFVKREFEVPQDSDGAWPPATKGLRLGCVVHNMRCHGAYREQVLRDKETLEREGWIYLCGSPEDEWNDIVLPALRQFRALHATGNVPAKFVVPASDPWPRTTWGFCLGQRVHTSHSLELYRDQLRRDKHLLHELGVSWFGSLDHKWGELIVPALVVYADVHGTESRIPVQFVVPSESPWPEPVWGLRLGEMVGRMRTRNHFGPQRSRDNATLTTRGLHRLLGITP